MTSANPARTQAIRARHKAAQFTRVFQVFRTDGVIHRFTTADRPISAVGTVFYPVPGVQASTVRNEAGLRDKTSELRVNVDSSGIFGPTFNDLRTRRLERAQVWEYRVDWRWPWAGPITFDVWHVLDVAYNEQVWTAELAGWTTWLKRKVGGVYESGCGNELGVNNGVDSYCRASLAAAPNRAAGVTVVAASGYTATKRKFRVGGASLVAATQIADWFARGRVEFHPTLGGLNHGFREQVIKSTAVAGSGSGQYTDIELAVAMPEPLSIGDRLDLVVGCDKQPTTCFSKFNRLIDYQNSPFVPGQDQAIRSGRTT